MVAQVQDGRFRRYERWLVRELYNDYPAWLETGTLAEDGCYGHIDDAAALALLLGLAERGVVMRREGAAGGAEWQLTPLAYQLVNVGDVRY